MNGDVTIKTKEGMTVRIPYTTISKVKLPNKPQESTVEIRKDARGASNKDSNIKKSVATK
jgi:hypothetical protein